MRRAKETLMGLSLLALGSAACETKNATAVDFEPSVATRSQRLNAVEMPPEARARLFSPTGMAAVSGVVQFGGGEQTDSVHAEYLLVADTKNHAIRRIDTSTGLTTTVVGTLGIPGASATQLRSPTAVFTQPSDILDPAASIFIADTGNHAIRVWGLDGSFNVNLRTVAGTLGRRGYEDAGNPLFDSPQGLASDGTTVGGHFQLTTLFVADTGNGVIRKINLSTSAVELVAGVPGQHGYVNGNALQAKFNRPTGLLKDGDLLYVADTGNHVIRAINLASGEVTKFAGTAGSYGHFDGLKDEAVFAQPIGLAGSSARLLVSDRASHTVREIVNGEVRALAGVEWQSGALEGDQAIARFRAPSGLGVIGDAVYVVDTGNSLVRKVRPTATGVNVSTLAGMRSHRTCSGSTCVQQHGAGTSDGWPEAFSIGQPKAITCTDDRLFIDGAGVQSIQLDPGAASGVVRTVATQDFAGDLTTERRSLVYANNALYRQLGYSFQKVDLATGIVGDGLVATPDTSTGAFAVGDVLYIDDSAGARRTYRVALQSGASEELSGRLFEYHPVWDGQYVYSRTTTSILRAASNTVPFATTEYPVALQGDEVRHMAAKDNAVYFTTTAESRSSHHHTIQRIHLATGAVDVFAGTVNSSSGPFNDPHQLCISGGNLFVADTGHGEVKKVDLASGAITTLTLRRP